VPVKSVWTSDPPKTVGWIVEPKTLDKGVLLARTLIAEDGDKSYVQVINSGPSPHSIIAGQ
jgi:hypothetical protein